MRSYVCGNPDPTLMMTDAAPQPSARRDVCLTRTEVSTHTWRPNRAHRGGHHTDSVSNHTIVYHPIKTPSHNHVGAIVGGVIGGLAGAALLALAALFFWRRRQRMRAEATRARALSPYSAPETIETSTASGSVLVQSPRKGQMAMDDGHRETAISSAPMSSSSALASAGAQSRAQGSSSAPAEELNELRREMGTLRQYIQEINAPPPSYRED